MPTLNQLVRKGRKEIIKKKKTRALQEQQDTFLLMFILVLSSRAEMISNPLAMF